MSGPFSSRARGALLVLLGAALGVATVAFISIVLGMPMEDAGTGHWHTGRSGPRFVYDTFGNRRHTAIWLALAPAALLSVLGLLQFLFGRPLRELPEAWDALHPALQRVIVYALLFAVPALIVWLAIAFF